MTEAQVRQILGRAIRNDRLSSREPGESTLAGDVEYLYWPYDGDAATLDGAFTADELEAIAWWMRAHMNDEPKSR